ncbi:MAG TPA: SDR family oxidoreductase [Chloroflexota bacterium]|nr:SDR family oxidoreductase [Chloroflexota bacterium]
MDLELKGKAALISGGSRGIGKAVARELAREGAAVAITARGVEALRATAAELEAETAGRVLPVSGDTSDDDSVRTMVQEAASQLGRIDILVNCAATAGGLTPPPKLLEVTNEDFFADMNVKVRGYLRVIQQVAPHMIENHWGRIINVSGLAARQAGTVVGSMRNVSVVALTKNVADELGKHGIGAVTVHPAMTLTEAGAGLIARRAAAEGISEEEAKKRIYEGNLQGRVITAADVANVIVFLCSPKAFPINGDVVVVGGGVPRAIYY